MNKQAELQKLFLKVILKDDGEAFKEIFYEYYSTLCVYSNKFLNSMEDAEDIVQESFYKIWKNRKEIEITSSFHNFLITTVKNSTLDFLRKKDFSNNYLQNLKSELHVKTPEELYTFNELEEKIAEALSKLPEHIREVFEMNRFKGLTYNEIAQEVSLSPKTIESYMSKALKILRLELKDYISFTTLFL